MEKDLENQLNKVIKKERRQGRLVHYMTKWGKLLLYILPLLLVIMALLTLLNITILDETL